MNELLRRAGRMAPDRGVIWRYGIAVLAVLAATGLRMVFHGVLGVQAPYWSFALAVVVAAWFGGRGPALAATALTALAVDWFFLGVPNSFAIPDLAAAWGLALFVAEVALIGLLVGSLRQSLLLRARAEEGLRRQAQLINLSQDAVITTDSGRRIVTWNKGAEEMYGWTERESAGKVLHELLQTADEMLPREMDEFLRREGRWHGELSHMARDGHRLLVDARQVLVRGEKSLPAGILEINRDITERKRIEEALRTSQGRFEFVLEAAQMGAWELDVARHTVWRSPQHDAIFGYPVLLPDWTYETFLDHVLPEDRQEVDRASQQAIASGVDSQLECRIRRADGVVRWIGVRGRSQRGEEGQPLRMSGIVQDITARKQVEEDLRHSEEQFRTLAEAIPQLCGMADADGGFFWSNQRWYGYTGLTPEQTNGLGWLSALDPEAVPEASERWQHSVADGEPFESVFPVRGADGIVRPFLARAMPVRDRDGKVARWFGTMTDISEQRKTEDALRKSHSEELARAAELQAIMDGMPVAMFISRDPECRNIIGNRRTYELLRLRPGSNVSKSAPPDEGPATVRFMKSGSEIPTDELPIQKAAATGQRVQDYELEAVLEDGTSLSLIGNAVPLLDAEGRSQGVVGIFADITEHKLAEERLRQMQKLESVGLLAGGIAHDFNNLLTVIMGSADYALTEYPHSEEIQNIITASERAAHLTRQLLAYAGKGQFITETFDLTDLVSRSRQLLSASVPKRASLVLYPPQEELLITADPSQIEQILMNLVTNAGEAIPPQTDGRIEIATSTCDVTPAMARRQAPAFDVQPGPFVCLEVTDNGVGMDEATLAQVFDPFFSTKFTGRGLGLAAVHGIVRSCKGFIEIRSSRGVGSTFRVFLPASQKKYSAETSIGTGPGPSRRRDRGSATILVVDDEEMVRKMACTALRRQGYEVLEAKDGRDALEVLAGAAPPPSLVLLDLAMPVMGGDELVPILNRRYPGLKIVVTSGYPEEEARKGMPPEAVAGFLEKPFTAGALEEIVDQVLKHAGPDSHIIESPGAG